MLPGCGPRFACTAAPNGIRPLFSTFIPFRRPRLVHLPPPPPPPRGAFFDFPVGSLLLRFSTTYPAFQHRGSARGRGLDARVRPGRARAGAGGCVRTGPGRARMSARVPEHALSNPFIPNACARVRALRGVSRPERTRTRAPSGLVSALAVRTAPGAIPCGRRAKAPHPGLFWTSAPVQTARERDQVGRCSDAHASDTRPHATA